MASNKAAKILEYINKNPEARSVDVAKMFGASVGYVSTLRNKMAHAKYEINEEILGLTEQMRVKEANTVSDILDERGARYGKFTSHAEITQRIKIAMVDSPNWSALSFDTREALEMVAHKIGRMLNGDPEYVDNVVDIIGYMQLVLDRMEGKVR